MANPNANSATLAGGGSTAVNNASPPGPRVTAADMYPMKVQNLSEIEGKGAVKKMQFPADLGKYYMTLDLHNYSRSTDNLMSVFTGGKLDISDKIILPLPQQMVDTHNVAYEQKSLGAVTGQITETVGEASKALPGGQQMTNLGQSLYGLAEGVMGKLLGGFDALTGSNITDVVKAVAGVAPNQFLTVLLQGPQYKKHSFTWKLSPRNEAESESIRSIIQKLNNSMAPGLSGGQGFFTFPKIAVLSFMPNSNVLFRFKPAVIESMSVNYAPSGAPAFYRRTEAPDTVELKLDFLEVEFWLDGDFGGDPINAPAIIGSQQVGGGRVGGGV